MARRNRTSVFEDVIHIIAKLPWWCGILIAVTSYIWLHNIASKPIPTFTPGTQRMGEVVVSQMWYTFAIYLQYIIPICSLIGSAISAYFKFTNKSLPENISQKPSSRAYSQKSAVDGLSKTQSTPECPQCGAPMVKRTAKKGSKAGESFWGCSDYPKCRGTRTSL